MGSVVWGGSTDSVGRFLGELQRRRVWRTAFAYAAVVFVLLQLGEIVFPAFGAPPLALRLLVVACFLGFPLAMALAWVFDITPGGIQKSDSQPAAEGGEGGYVGSALPRLALLAVTLATVGGVGWWALHDTLEAETGIPGSGSEGPVAASTLTPEPPVQIRSLAVLPLDDFSQEEGGEYFTAGLHEELIFQLSQIAAARVLSRTTVVQYDQEGKTMPVIARELGVEGVVEGSVFRDGNRVKITVQLIHGPTDRHVWSNVYEGTMEDAIALQRTVAQAIATEIQAELFPDDGLPEEAGVRIAASPVVQEEYLRARFEQSKATPQSLESAVSHYQAALELDSAFAPAYAGLAAAKLLLGLQSGDSTAFDPGADEEVTRALEQALTLDSRSPEARAVLLTLQGSLERLPTKAIPSVVTLVRDSANLLEAEVTLAGSDFGHQLLEAVTAHPERSGFRPSPAQRIASARRLQAASRLDQAETVVREVAREVPGSAEAWDALEQLKVAQGDFEGVLAVRRDRLAQSHVGGAENDSGGAALEELRGRLAEEGEAGYWRWRLDDLLARRDEGERVSSVELARACLGLGEPEQALDHLEEASARRDPNLLTLWTDPWWDGLRTSPRFREILSQVRSGRDQDGMHSPERLR